MTEENHHTESSSSSTRSSPLVQAETQTITPDPTIKNRDIKKEKCRAMTKVVIRRLPPTMNQNQFVEQISPLPDHDYLYFVKADLSLGQYAFSRAYINFTDQRDIFIFREKFDNYVFVDSKGTEYPAVVEFAPFQRLPKKRTGKKKDVKCGSIETDPYYTSFLESLQNADDDPATAQPKTEYSYQPADNTQKKVTTTPLLEYLKQRKQEKQRLKDEKREERRRRDLERRRAKDEPTISKVLKNPETEKESSRELRETTRDDKDKQGSREQKARNKGREDKGRDKAGGRREGEGKMQGKQQQFGRERGDERNRETKHQKRNEDKRSHKRDEKEQREGGKEERKYENKYDKRDKKIESKDETRETKERKLEEKRGKSYEKMRLEKKRLAENKKGGGGGGGGDAQSSSKGNSTRSGMMKREDRDSTEKREKKLDTAEKREKKSLDETSMDISVDNSIVISSSQKNDLAETLHSRLELDLAEEIITEAKSKRRNQYQDEDADGNSTRSRFHESENIDYDDRDCSSTTKKVSKIVLRRSSLESGADGGGADGNLLRRHKSLDGGEQENLRKNEHRYKAKNKKDPRLERRIRNKDRPAMEIYRPGMGRFSKQRLEREKSMNDDRASLSQSPTPISVPSSSSNTTKVVTSKQSSSAQAATASSPTSEVLRSMTFKRSASRDLP